MPESRATTVFSAGQRVRYRDQDAQFVREVKEGDPGYVDGKDQVAIVTPDGHEKFVDSDQVTAP